MPKAATAATPRSFKFNSEAKIMQGSLRLPVTQTIHPQGHTQLPEEGGYKCVHTGPYRLEGVLSYEAARSQVAGNPGTKPGLGWATLTTTVIEKLNILEVLTADRVVGQIICNHPAEGYVPEISFLGTRFENLRFAGHPVELELNLDLLGPKPAKDGGYTTEPAVVSRVGAQYARIVKNKKLPAAVTDKYNRLNSKLAKAEAVECSLVNQAAGFFPGVSAGHVLHIPHFGIITLGRLTVTHSNHHPKTGAPTKTLVQLRMVDLQLGCAIDGEIGLADLEPNGAPPFPP